MKTGRTSPALCGCEDVHGESVGDYVVKLRGGIDSGPTGLVCELFASLLATHFEIATPEPAVVEIDLEFAAVVADVEPA
jgi:hypothetical protein